MRKLSLSLATSLVAIAFSGAAFAADVPAAGASAPGRHHGPSAAALAACNGKAEGAAVSWTGRSGQQRTGTCVTRDGQMAAHGPHKAHGHGPAASGPTN